MKQSTRILLAVLLGVGSAAPSTADADTLKDEQTALAAITDAADKICNIVTTRGEYQSARVDGNINTQLAGLLKKLTDFGISGAGNFTIEEYKGVLRQDLPAVLRNNSECKLKIFDDLQRKMLPNHEDQGSSKWQMTQEQAEALRLRLQPISVKPKVYIKCRTTEEDCEKLSDRLYDVLTEAEWPVAEPMTTRNGNVFITGEKGIKVISKNESARLLKDALQAREVGVLPAELLTGGDGQTILINIGKRP